MGNVNTKITGDAQDLIREQKKVAEGAAEVTSEYRDLLRESQRLGSVATRAWKETRTDLEKYEAKIRDLNAAHKKGKLDSETHARAIALAKKEFEESQQSASGLLSILGQFGKAAAGIGIATSATAMFRAEFERVNEIAKEAAERMKSGFGMRGTLAQVISGNTKEERQQDFEFLKSESNLFRSEGGAQSQELADSLVFALRSTGFIDQAATFRGLGRTGLVPAAEQEPVINALDSLRDALGEAEVGTASAMLSKFLTTSSVTQVPISRLAPIAQAAPSARALGIGDEELLGALGAISDSSGGPEEARTMLKALFTAFEKEGISGPFQPGQALTQRMDIVRNAIAGGAQIRDVLGGSEEAVMGFRMLENNQQAFRELVPKLTAANDGQALRDAMEVLEKDPDQMAVAATVAAKGLTETTSPMMQAGREEMLRQSLIQTMDQYEAVRGAWGLQRWASNQAVGWMSYFGGADAIMPNENALNIQRRELEAAGNQDAIKLLDQIMKLQTEVLELEKEKKAARERVESKQSQPKPAVPAPET